MNNTHIYIYIHTKQTQQVHEAEMEAQDTGLNNNKPPHVSTHWL